VIAGPAGVSRGAAGAVVRHGPSWPSASRRASSSN
jgi:hypothetical protein